MPREETWLVTSTSLAPDGSILAEGQLEDVEGVAYFHHATSFVVPADVRPSIDGSPADAGSVLAWVWRLRRVTAYLTREGGEGGYVTAARFERRREEA